MTREPLVHERVVGVQQIEHVLVFADDVVEEELRLADHRVRERRVELRIEPRVGMDLVEILQPQPLRREPCRERRRARIGEQAARLLLEPGRRAQRALRCRRDQLVVCSFLADAIIR